MVYGGRVDDLQHRLVAAADHDQLSDLLMIRRHLPWSRRLQTTLRYPRGARVNGLPAELT
jgi:hypothetical protein